MRSLAALATLLLLPAVLAASPRSKQGARRGEAGVAVW